MKDVYFTIYSLMTEGYSVTDIAKKIGTTKQRLNRYVSTLKKAKLIEKIGYGTWRILKNYDENMIKQFINTHSRSFLKKTVKGHPILQENNTRGHAFIYKVKINRINIKNIKYILGKKGKFYELIKKTGIKLELKGFKIHLWPKKIIIYDERSYVANKAFKCKKQAISNMHNVMTYLIRILKIDKDYVFLVVRSHYAVMNDEGAKHFRESGDKIQVKDEYGTWHLMDKSFNIDEAEFWKNKNPDRSQDIKDTDGYSSFINDKKKHKWKVNDSVVIEGFKEVNKTFQKQAQVASKQIQSSQAYYDNIASHIKAIKDLSKGVIELRKEIKKINKK